VCVFVCVCACVRACMRACVRACVCMWNINAPYGQICSTIAMKFSGFVWSFILIIKIWGNSFRELWNHWGWFKAKEVWLLPNFSYYNIAHSVSNMNLLCSSGVDAGRALQLLTQPGPYALPSLENVVSRATSNLVTRPEETPISDDQLNAILHVSTVALLLLHCDLIYRPHSGVLQFDDSWPCR